MNKIYAVFCNTYKVDEEEIKYMRAGLLGVFDNRARADKVIREAAFNNFGVSEDDWIDGLDCVIIPTDEDGKFNDENEVYNIELRIKETEMNRVLSIYD